MKILPLIMTLVVVAACGAAPTPRLADAERLGGLGQAQFAAADGELLSVADFRGQVVLVEFWATWCKPCTEALSYYDSWQQALGADRFRVVAVSIDDEAVAVADVLRQFAPNVELLRDPGGSRAAQLGLVDVPTSVLLDRNGNVVIRRTGYGYEELEVLRAAINRLLRESPG